MERAEALNIYRPILFVLVVIALCVSSVTVFPSKTFALEMSARTQQILPLGENTCTPISVTSFTPYIYDGALHSFEFTVSDPSYVAFLGSVGNTSFSFDVMGRHIDASGSLRIHVDIETTAISGMLPLQVTLLSARTGQPVCLGIVSMSVGSGPQVQSTISDTPIPTVSVTEPSVTPNIPSVASWSTDPGAPSSTSSKPAETTSNTYVTSVVSIMKNTLKSLCVSETSAYSLWLILLVLFALVIGVALRAKFPMSMTWVRSPESIATLILILLLFLLGFWYFYVPCRAALWMPLAAFLIAILGLLASFWNHPRVTQLLLNRDSKI